MMRRSPTPSPTLGHVPPKEGSPAARSGMNDASIRSGVSPAVFPSALEDAQDVRRVSVTFLPQLSGRTGSPKPSRPGSQRRMSSPPPPPSFEQRVGFDTFNKPSDSIEQNSFTLSRHHKDYKYSRRSRTFLCGIDANEYSEDALEYLFNELVEDGDQVVCIRVVDRDSPVAAELSVEQGKYRNEAEELMDHILERANKAIDLVLEFAVGKVNKVIDDMIELYEPAMLVVGTRGRGLGGIQGLLPGSVSKYCLQHSPIPVTVVRQQIEREKSKRQRESDPNRQAYKRLIELTGIPHPLDPSNPNSSIEPTPPMTDEEAALEAAAVAREVGYNPDPLPPPPPPNGAAQGPETAATEPSTPASAKSTSTVDEASLEEQRSPDVLSESPELQNLESPAMSEVTSEEEQEAAIIKETLTQDLALVPKPDSPDSSKAGEKPQAEPNPPPPADTLTLTENVKPGDAGNAKDE